MNEQLNFFSLLLAEHVPEPEGRSSSGRGRRAEGASETQSGGDPGTAGRPGDTSTPASSPTYTPGHPGEAKESDKSIQIQTQRYIFPYSSLAYQPPFYTITSRFLKPDFGPLLDNDTK